MAKNNSPTGFTGSKAMSAEDLNTAMRGDIGSTYMKGPTQQSYVGMGQDSRNAIAGINNASRSTGILRDAVGYNRGLLQSGGLTEGQRGAMSGMSDVAGKYGEMYDRGGAGNPHLDDIISQTNDNTYADVMASLGSSGMTGSNIHVNELGNALAENESRLRYQDFGDSFNRQGSALQGMAGANTGLFGMGQTGTANAMGAADRAGILYENTLMPSQIRLQANSMLDADARAKAAFDPQYEHLLKYQGLLGGNAAAPQPAKKPGFMDYAGLGLGLFSAFA